MCVNILLLLLHLAIAAEMFRFSTAIVVAVFLISFLFICTRYCYGDRRATTGGYIERAPISHRSTQQGLHIVLLKKFPTFAYSLVKELKLGKETLECAICLSEFSDNETLRLLPACSHVFHLECIDAWLGSHVTCPVCRTDLAASPDGSLEKGKLLADDLAISTGSEDEAVVLQRPKRYPRSHTTGHSMDMGAGVSGCDRHTLWLPEHVRKEIVTAAWLRRTTSCGFRGGEEASGRRGYWSELQGGGKKTEESVKKREGSFKRVQFECVGGGKVSGANDDDSLTVASRSVLSLLGSTQQQKNRLD